MKDRIKKIIDHYMLSSAKFAEVLGVQRSNVSHILSGRNKPSLDFVQKILQNYPQLKSDWLLFGKGNMFASGMPKNEEKEEVKTFQNKKNTMEKKVPVQKKPQTSFSLPPQSITQENTKEIERVIIFYTDKTFDVYSINN